MILASGVLGVRSQACMVLLMNVSNIIYMAAVGAQFGVCAIVGNRIGQAKLKETKLYISATHVVNFFLPGLVAGLIYVYYDNIIRSMTNIE